MESPRLLNPTSIINLNLSFKNLLNIEEIKQYKNLIELDLSGNNFKDPEESLKALAMFPYLKKINLAYNNLNFVPPIPRNIETLILNHNSLFSLNENLVQSMRLTTLDLSNNFIVDVSILQKISTLKYLFLKNNKVKSFGVLAALDKLQELDLEGNNINNPNDLNSFSKHPSIKILCIRNTPLNKDQNIKQNPQNLITNLPFYREGAFCRSPKTLKNSFTYTNMLETSNPNRSVLINKSLINSKKHISEEELSDEFSFDQTPHDIINGSLLGSIRSNLLETAERGVSENTTRRDRSNNLSLDMNKAITSENRNPTNEKENIKGIGSHTGHAQSSLENLINTKTRIPFLAKPKAKPDMKLNLSKIVKANSFDRGPLGFESMSYADFQKNDFKKNDHIQNPKMDFPPPTITTTNRSQPNRENKFSLPVTTENERANTDSVKFSANQTLNSFVNQLESGRPISSYRITFQNESLSLNEAYEGLKKENQDLRRSKDELIQRINFFEKDNEELSRLLEVFENDNQNLCLRVDTLETENNELVSKLKDLESQNIRHVERLQKLLESYQDKENVICNQKHLNFDDLLQMVQEKLKKFEGMIQVDMNTRILEKFDQLRDYYRKKQERYIMTINDLESQINFQLSSKIEQLENTTSSLNANYQSLMKKYSQLKKQTELHKKTDSRNICNTSLNLNNTRNFRLLNLSVEALETSPDIHERERKKKFDNFIPPKIQFRKEVKVDDHYSKLKFENFQLKNSLDGVNKKMESLLKENDELKTETNRNTYSLKLRLKELMGENSRLHRIINQRKFRDLVTTHHTSFDKNYDTNLKARHVSCEDSPHSSFIVESLRYSIDKQKRDNSLLKDSTVKNQIAKLKKRNENLDKELKFAKEKNSVIAKKLFNFVDYAKRTGEVLDKYPQLRSLCIQLQDVLQNA